MTARLASITLDERTILKRAPEVEHERNSAITDLLRENAFAPQGLNTGPYALEISVREGRLVFNIQSQAKDEKTQLVLSMQPLKSVVRDYFILCESYYETVKNRNSTKIEAIDAGRRGLHNEGATLLQDLLKDRISVDFPTARRLFTLICVLHIR